MIAGNSILYLPTCTSLQNSDLLLVSERDKYLHDTYDTKHLSTQDFMQYMVQAIVEDMHLGTMSSENENSYSQVSHAHDNLYNKLSALIPLNVDESKTDLSTLAYSNDPQYVFDSYPIIKPKNDLWLSIGNMFIDGRLSTTYIPLSCALDYAIIPWQMIEPRVGDIKFIALTSIASNADIDYTSQSFDGWLYPDGTTEFPLTAFHLSDHILNIPNKSYNESTGKFKLPNLRTFAKIKSKTNTLNTFSYVNFNNDTILNHYHDVDIVANGTITTQALIDITKYPGAGGKLHNGNAISHQADGSYLKKTKYGKTNHTLSEYLLYDSKKIRSLAPKDDVSDNPYAGQTWKDIWKSFNNIVYTNDIDISCKCNVNMTATGIVQNSAASLNRETHPSYQLLPVMMYVGKNNRIM